MTKTLENALQDEHGTMVTLSTTQRDAGIEERFGIFPGEVYGVRICGTNPELGISYVGRLKEVSMHVCSNGFVLDYVELRNGYSSCDGIKTPFEKEVLLLRRERVTDFGRIEDEEGFRRTRKNIRYQK